MPEPTIGRDAIRARVAPPIRVGAVSYLNARPLWHILGRLAPHVEIVVDVPSRLAEGLDTGDLDVALVSSIQHFRTPGSTIVSDACVACHGPVRSLKLYGRVPPEQIRTLALDDGSRTSAALVRILLEERFGLRPRIERLAIGASAEDTTADAVMLIGDRGMRAPEGRFHFVWDLGEEWCRWTGLPFVCAMWVARPSAELGGLDRVLAAARDDGQRHLEEIARLAAPDVGLPEHECLAYLRENIKFRLGERERRGLMRFGECAARCGLAPAGRELAFYAEKGVRNLLPERPEGCSAQKVPDTFVRVLDKAIEGGRLGPEEGLRLLESHGLAALGRAADAVARRLHPEPYRTYNIDRNINYTNVCTSGCRFCAFSRRLGDPEGYILSREELFRKIDETLALGGDQILLQGGMHPELGIEWYEDLLRDIKQRYPALNVHGFSPPEIHHLSQASGKSIDEVLDRLQAAGLGSLPGGGAEILVDRVRRLVSPCKVSADGWLDVCRRWHRRGGRGSATMMFGHVETYAERIEHLDRLRRLQDETGGFTAFICWTFQPRNTALAGLSKVGPAEYLKTLAVSRLYLDNFANLQASWVTQGLKIGQLALRFGADDLGSMMIEENVVAAAGTRFRATHEEMLEAIRGAGHVPRRRNVSYHLVDGPPRK